MTKYVKIKKAKNLRFRLISVLYLLFISLSIIQIPIEWFRINPTMASYLASTTSKDVVVLEIRATLDAVDQIDAEFTKSLGYDEKNKIYREPNGYSSTDNFFIIKKKSKFLFEKLTSLKNYFQKMPTTNPKRKEFERLFAGDLENGLSNNKFILWSEWKFKHVPATVVKTLLAELKLRLNLLNGVIELEAKGDKIEKIVMLAYNLDVLKPGDTATFVVSKKAETSVKINLAGSPVNDYKWKGDTLYFIPKTTGQYEVVFDSKGVFDKLNITVIPAGFDDDKKETLQTFFVGKKASVRYTNVLKADKVMCSCSESNTITQSSGKIEFTPTVAGWCAFQVNGGNGQPLLYDSIYIQDLPTPKIVVNGSSNGAISVNRLMQTRSVSISAIHPEMLNFNYDVIKVNYTIIGVNRETKSSQGAKIDLSGMDVAKIKYLLINEVDIKTTVKLINLKEPVLIEIIKS
jgi:hypothetical protein